MNFSVVIIGVYGLISIVGGIVGYAKARSVASLIAGSVSGIVLLACAYGLMHGSRAAAIVSAVMAIALGGRFFGVWLRKRRVMPDLIMVFGALIVLASLLLSAH